MAAESICTDFDPVIQGEYFQVTIKNEEMLSWWKTPYSHMPGQKMGLALELLLGKMAARGWLPIMDVDYSDPFVQDQANWTRLEIDQSRIFDQAGNKEWKEFWVGNKLPFTVRIPLPYLVS